MLGLVRTQFAWHWRVLVFLAVAAAARATTLATTGIGATAPLVVTVLSAVLLRTGTGKTPRPRLELGALHDPPLWPATETARSLREIFGEPPELPDTAPTTQPPGLVVGRHRALDVDAVVEDALRSARAEAPGATANRLVMGLGRE